MVLGIDSYIESVKELSDKELSKGLENILSDIASLADENEKNINVEVVLQNLFIELITNEKIGVIDEVLKGRNPDIVKKQVCEVVGELNISQLECTLLSGVIGGTAQYSLAAARAMINMKSPWLGTILCKENRSKIRSIGPTDIDELFKEYVEVCPWWDNALDANISFISRVPQKTEHQWVAAKMLALDPDEVINLGKNTKKNVVKKYSEAIAEILEIIEKGTGKIPELFRQWLYRFVFIFPSVTEDNDLIKRVENYIFKVGHEKDMRNYFLNSSRSNKENYITRCLKRFPNEVVPRALFSIDLLSNEFQFLIKEVRDSLIKGINSKDNAVKLASSLLLFQYDPVCEPAIKSLNEALQHNLGEQGHTEALNAFTERDSKTVGPILKNLTNADISAYLANLFKNKRYDLIEKDASAFLDSLEDIYSIDKLYLILDFVDSMSIEVGILNDIFIEKLILKTNNYIELLHNEGRNLFLQKCNKQWLIDKIVSNLPPHTLDQFPDWWQEFIITQIITREDKPFSISQIVDLKIIRQEKIADLAVDLWTNGSEIVENEIFYQKIPHDLFNEIIQKAFSRLNYITHKLEQLGDEKDKSLPLWLKTTQEDIVAQLIQVEKDLVGNDKLQSQTASISQSLRGDLTSPGNTNAPVQSKQDIPESIIKLIHKKLLPLGLNWQDLESVKYEGTWLESSPYPDAKLNRLADFIGELARKAFLSGALCKEDQQITRKYLSSILKTLHKAKALWPLWTLGKNFLRRANDAFLGQYWRTVTENMKTEDIVHHLIDLDKTKFCSASGSKYWPLETLIRIIVSNQKHHQIFTTFEPNLKEAFLRRFGLLLRENERAYKKFKTQIEEIAFQGKSLIAHKIKDQLTLLEASIGPIFKLRLILREKGILTSVNGLGRIVSPEEQDLIVHEKIGEGTIKSQYMLSRSFGIRLENSEEIVEPPIFEQI